MWPASRVPLNAPLAVRLVTVDLASLKSDAQV
jgi:hypothetical protein